MNDRAICKAMRVEFKKKESPQYKNMIDYYLLNWSYSTKKDILEETKGYCINLPQAIIFRYAGELISNDSSISKKIYETLKKAIIKEGKVIL